MYLESKDMEELSICYRNVRIMSSDCHDRGFSPILEFLPYTLMLIVDLIYLLIGQFLKIKKLIFFLMMCFFPSTFCYLLNSNQPEKTLILTRECVDLFSLINGISCCILHRAWKQETN